MEMIGSQVAGLVDPLKPLSVSKVAIEMQMDAVFREILNIGRM